MSSIPLVVDLDGTFAHTDSTWSMLHRLALRRPHVLPRLFAVLRSGDRAELKLLLWQHVPLELGHLRICAPVAAFARSEAAHGRPVHLVTGAPQALAEIVARAYPIFETVCGTTGGRNLTAHGKADYLVVRFGRGGFDYAGNSRDDLPVWSVCRRAIVCNAPAAVRRAAAKIAVVERVI